jgi:hypothetical protein
VSLNTARGDAQGLQRRAFLQGQGRKIISKSVQNLATYIDKVPKRPEFELAMVSHLRSTYMVLLTTFWTTSGDCPMTRMSSK